MLRCVKFVGNLNYALSGSGAYDPTKTGISTLPNAPNLAGQPEIYLAEQLKDYRSGKRSNEIMSLIAKPLTDAEITDLSAWFASIAIEAKPPR